MKRYDLIKKIQHYNQIINDYPNIFAMSKMFNMLPEEICDILYFNYKKETILTSHLKKIVYRGECNSPNEIDNNIYILYQPNCTHTWCKVNSFTVHNNENEIVYETTNGRKNL